MKQIELKISGLVDDETFDLLSSGARLRSTINMALDGRMSEIAVISSEVFYGGDKMVNVDGRFQAVIVNRRK